MSANIPNTPTAIQRFFTSRDNNANASTYVGQEQRLWYDPITNAIYVSDGNTAGGIAVGSSGSGNGVPGGPTNSIQYNAGGGFFGGTSNIVVSGTGMSVTGNVTASYFIGNVQFTGGNIDLGNLYIVDQTIGGTNINANINITPEGSGVVNVPGLGILPVGTFLQPYVAVGNANPGIELLTVPGYDITLAPGATANILTAGNILPTGNNIAALGDINHRYTGLWLGSGNINLIDQGTGDNQEIYVQNGNIIFADSTGAQFGDFLFYGNTMALKDAAANIIVGTANATGWVQFNRSIAVSTTAGTNAFRVTKDGRTEITVPDSPANSSGALNIIGSTGGAYQNVTNSGGMIHITGVQDSAARITVDAFGASAGSGVPGVLVFRSARGTATTPTATQANDTLARISSVGWGNTPGFGAGAGLAATAIEFVALETFTPTAQGTKITFNTANVGSNSRSVSATVQSNGISFLNNTVANSGITFNDGSFQNTAFISSQSVSSITVTDGLAQNGTAPQSGAVIIDNTGVLRAVGTPQQIRINGSYTATQTGNIVLALPQDIAPNSTVTFGNVTITGNLNVTGNTVSGNTIALNSKLLQLANNSSSNTDINFGGIALGNIDASYSRTILYDLSNDRWTTAGSANSSGISNFYSPTLFSANVVTDYLDVTYTGHFGTAYDGNDFAQAEIQAYSDVNSFGQIVNWNKNAGGSASADFVAVNDLGNTTNDIHYIDLGINSSTYGNTDYAVSGPNDGYLYINGGNLIIGTQDTGNVIKFHTGGTDDVAYIRATISDTGISAVGNVTANNFIGNAMAVTTITGTTISAAGTVTGLNVSAVGGVTAASVVGTTVSATGNVIAGNVRTTGQISAAGNIIAGNLVTATTTIDGGVSTSGNVSAGNITASGTISAIGNISTPNLNASVAVVSTLLSISGNITGGNLITSGLISTTGNATFGNVGSAGSFSATGNVDAGNLRTSGLVVGTAVSATGNITGSYFIGNGSQLTGLATNLAFGNVYANGTAVLATTGSSTITVTPGNNQVITGNNGSKTLTIAVNDNPTFGNITVTGNIITANTTYINNVGNIYFSNTAPLPTAVPGTMEYDGKVLYFTPQDQERGAIASQEWYVLNADRGLTFASTTPQSLFGVGAHVSNGTRYWFRIKASISRGAGTNNTSLTLGWRGSAVLSKISYTVQSSIGTAATVKTSYMYENTLVSGFTDQATVTTGNNPPDTAGIVIIGIIDVGASGGGYVDPYISWTGAAAAGSVTVSSLSNFQIGPLGATGANTSVGNWG